MQVSPTLSRLRPLRLARRRHLRPAADSAAVGRRRQRAHLRHATSSSRAALTYMPSATSLLEVRFGWSSTEGRQESGGARHGERAGRLRHHRPADRSARRRRPADAADHRLLGSRPPGHQPAVAVPDGLQPEGQLHAGCRAGTRSRPATSSSASQTEVQDVNPLYGRDSYAGQFTRPAGAAAQQPLQPRRLHARPALDLCAQQHPRRRPAAEHALHLSAGRLARQRSADAERSGCATSTRRRGSRRTTCCRTSIRRRKTMVLATDGSLEDRSTLKPDRNNFGPRLGLAYTLDADRTVHPRRLRHQLRALPPRRRRATCCRSTARR